MTTHKHHIENLTVKKLLTQFFDFGLAHAQKRSLGLDRENAVVGKNSLMAATVYNKRFCEIAALTR